MKRLMLVLFVLCWRAPLAMAQEAEACDETHAFSKNPCNTPRSGVVSGYYLALDAGYATADTTARRKVHLGGVRPLEVRLGLEFWDHLLLELGAGRFGFKDYAPTSEKIVRCTTFMGATLDCDDKSSDKRSEVSTAFVSFQGGLQHRFRPTRKLSLVPGVMIGYVMSPKGVKREVTCKGCPSGEKLDLEVDGAAITPFLRLTMATAGMLALIVRSRWFLTGDLVQQTTFGVEFGLP